MHGLDMGCQAGIGQQACSGCGAKWGLGSGALGIVGIFAIW